MEASSGEPGRRRRRIGFAARRSRLAQIELSHYRVRQLD